MGGVVAEEDGESHHVPIVQAALERGGSEAVGALSMADVTVGAVGADSNGESGVWDIVLTRSWLSGRFLITEGLGGVCSLGEGSGGREARRVGFFFSSFARSFLPSE